MSSRKLSLFDANPELAAQWHPTKNGRVTPHDVYPFSNRRIWWLCPKDPRHEWEAPVYARTAGNGCPDHPCCTRPRASPWYNLRTEYPKIAEQFHPSKNGDTTPEQIVPFSTKKYWWRCAYGHEWKVRVDSRTVGNGCRTCHAQTSKLELRLYCELKFLFRKSRVRSQSQIAGRECDIYVPAYKLAIEVDGYPWHKNKQTQDSQKSEVLKKHHVRLIRLRDERLEHIEGQVLWFNCFEDYRILVRRVVRHLCDKNLLSSYHHKRCRKYLASNDFKNPDEYKKLVPTLRLPRPGMSLVQSHPKLANEWDVQDNAPLTPEMYSAGSHEEVAWRCMRCQRSWPAEIKSRARSVKPGGCPYCAGRLPTETNNLKANHPAIAAEWDDEKNGTLRPEDVTPCSHRKVWWKCPLGHSWDTTVANRTAKNGTGCRFFPCRPKRGPVTREYNLMKSHPQVAKEWHQSKNGTRRPQDVTHGMDLEVWWKCKKCGHIWKAAISGRTSGGRGCSKCRRRERGHKLATQ